MLVSSSKLVSGQLQFISLPIENNERKGLIKSGNVFVYESSIETPWTDDVIWDYGGTIGNWAVCQKNGLIRKATCVKLNNVSYHLIFYYTTNDISTLEQLALAQPQRLALRIQDIMCIPLLWLQPIFSANTKCRLVLWNLCN